MSTPEAALPLPADDTASVADYKAILREVLDLRPSGMRRRLAEALDKNPSFVSQIANPSYPTPIPATHVETILEICHFSPSERARFLRAYEAAHPRRALKISGPHRHRHVSLRLPDFDDADRNREMDRMLHDFAARLTKLFEM